MADQSSSQAFSRLSAADALRRLAYRQQDEYATEHTDRPIVNVYNDIGQDSSESKPGTAFGTTSIPVPFAEPFRARARSRSRRRTLDDLRKYDSTSVSPPGISGLSIRPRSRSRVRDYADYARGSASTTASTQASSRPSVQEGRRSYYSSANTSYTNEYEERRSHFSSANTSYTNEYVSSVGLPRRSERKQVSPDRYGRSGYPGTRTRRYAADDGRSRGRSDYEYMGRDVMTERRRQVSPDRYGNYGYAGARYRRYRRESPYGNRRDRSIDRAHYFDREVSHRGSGYSPGRSLERAGSSYRSERRREVSPSEYRLPVFEPRPRSRSLTRRDRGSYRRQSSLTRDNSRERPRPFEKEGQFGFGGLQPFKDGRFFNDANQTGQRSRKDLEVAIDSNTQDVSLSEQHQLVKTDASKDRHLNILNDEASWLNSALSGEEVDVDMTAILDPSYYADELDKLEGIVFEKCDVMSLLRIDGNADVAALEPTPDDQLELRFTGLTSAIDAIQEGGLCTDNIVYLAQDESRENVIQARTVPISDVWVLSDRNLTMAPDSAHLDMVTAWLCYVFGMDTAYPPLSWAAVTGFSSSEAFLGILCSLLRLTVAFYVRSHCSGLPWDEDSSVKRITYKAPNGSTHAVRCRALACLHEFIQDEVWVFDAADDDTRASVSISVRQLADLWGPIFAVPSSSQSNEYSIAIQTEGGLLYRSHSPTSTEKLLGSEVPCHWTRAVPACTDLGWLVRDQDKSTLSFKSFETFPQKLQEFNLTRRLLIGHPTSSQGTSTTVLSSTPIPTDFSHNAQCCLDLETFGRQNAFKIQTSGVHEAYYSPDEHHIALSAGQYVNVGLQKTWKRRPAITRKDRILSFCATSLASAERVKQILQLRLGLEVSACTFSARRVTLEDLLEIAFPNDVATIADACATGNALIVAAYLGELKPTGLDHNQVGMFHWPLSVGMSEVYRVETPPMWLGLLQDTPETCCFAALSGRCLQFTICEQGRLHGSLCTSTLKGMNSPALQTCIEIDPSSTLRPPLNPSTRVPLAFGELRIHQRGGKSHAAVYSRTRSVWSVGRSRRHRANVHRELQVASRPSQYTFDVCMIDAK